MRSVRRSGAIAAVLAAGLLAGCAGQPGVAAVIGDRTVTQAQLDTATEELSPILNTVDQRALLLALVLGSEVLPAAEEQGVAVSAEAAVDQMDQVAEVAGVEPVDWSPISVEIIQVVLAGQALGMAPDGGAALQAAEEAALAQDVEISPRHGTLDRESRQVQPQQLDWIVQPEAGEA